MGQDAIHTLESILGVWSGEALVRFLRESFNLVVRTMSGWLAGPPTVSAQIAIYDFITHSGLLLLACAVIVLAIRRRRLRRTSG